MKLWLQFVALVLMLLSMPIVSYGTTEEIAWIWWAGLIILVAGGLIPAALRYVPLPGEGDGGDDSDDNGDQED